MCNFFSSVHGTPGHGPWGTEFRAGEDPQVGDTRLLAWGYNQGFWSHLGRSCLNTATSKDLLACTRNKNNLISLIPVFRLDFRRSTWRALFLNTGWSNKAPRNTPPPPPNREWLSQGHLIPYIPCVKFEAVSASRKTRATLFLHQLATAQSSIRAIWTRTTLPLSWVDVVPCKDRRLHSSHTLLCLISFLRSCSGRLHEGKPQ